MMAVGYHSGANECYRELYCPEDGNSWLLYTSAHGAICVISVAWR